VATIEEAVEVHLLEHIKAMSERCDVMVIVDTADPRFRETLGRGVAVRPVAIQRRVSLWRDGLALGRLQVGGPLGLRPAEQGLDPGEAADVLPLEVVAISIADPFGDGVENDCE
jgi:hypothetical protein